MDRSHRKGRPLPAYFSFEALVEVLKGLGDAFYWMSITFRQGISMHAARDAVRLLFERKPGDSSPALKSRVRCVSPFAIWGRTTRHSKGSLRLRLSKMLIRSFRARSIDDRAVNSAVSWSNAQGIMKGFRDGFARFDERSEAWVVARSVVGRDLVSEPSSYSIEYRQPKTRRGL